MEAILNTTTRKSTYVILALLGILAFSACSQKASEETGAKAKATVSNATASKPVAKSPHLAQANSYPSEPLATANHMSCANCGVVVTVKEIDQEGKGSGLGVVAGGVAGGVLGNQVGNGSGRDLATIAGIFGGAIAGNKIEEKIKKTRVYEVTVKMENGEERVISSKTVPGVMAGDKVKVEGERLVRL